MRQEGKGGTFGDCYLISNRELTPTERHTVINYVMSD